MDFSIPGSSQITHTIDLRDFHVVLLIGTFCILEDIILLHDDKDFEQMEKHLSKSIISLTELEQK
jgi:hypothetical protein